MPHYTKADKANKVSQTEADRRKSVALAGLRELELRKKADELVEKRSVEQATFRLFRNLRDAILAVTDRICPIVTAETDQHKNRATIDKELRDALDRFADAIPAG